MSKKRREDIWITICGCKDPETIRMIKEIFGHIIKAVETDPRVKAIIEARRKKR